MIKKISDSRGCYGIFRITWIVPLSRYEFSMFDQRIIFWCSANKKILKKNMTTNFRRVLHEFNSPTFVPCIFRKKLELFFRRNRLPRAIPLKNREKKAIAAGCSATRGGHSKDPRRVIETSIVRVP